MCSVKPQGLKSELRGLNRCPGASPGSDGDKRLLVTGGITRPSLAAPSEKIIFLWESNALE